MKIGVYMTCHGKFLDAFEKFYDGVQVFGVENWVLFQNSEPFPAEWMDVDAFIYQPILAPPSEYYKDENLLENFVSQRATRIRVPYLMHTGLYPWYEKPPVPQLQTAYGISWVENDLPAFLSGAKGVDDILYAQGRSIEENHLSSLALLRDKEQTISDIDGFADYIEEHLQTSALFWTPNHPRGQLAELLCRKVAGLLGLPPLPGDAYDFLDRRLSPEQCPILPCVRQALGVRHNEDVAYFDHDRVPMTSAQYVDRYIKVHQAIAAA